MPPENLAAALGLAARGWPVLPLCWPSFGPDGTARCGCGQGHEGRDIGKAPVGRLVPGGFKNATTDPATLRRWWSACPDANVGVALGPAGLVAVDCDAPDALAEALRRGLPHTLLRRSRAPAFIYSRPQDCPPTRRSPRQGLDILADGYLVVWGKHHDGHDVRLEPFPPADPAPAPGWVLDALRGQTRPAPADAAPPTGLPVRLPPDARPETLSPGDLAALLLNHNAAPAALHRLGLPAPPPPPGRFEAGPVLLPERFRPLWEGRTGPTTPDGRLDRSRLLFALGALLLRANASPAAAAQALAERDRTLGLVKYASRRDGGAAEYRRIVEKAAAVAVFCVRCRRLARLPLPTPRTPAPADCGHRFVSPDGVTFLLIEPFGAELSDDLFRAHREAPPEPAADRARRSGLRRRPARLDRRRRPAPHPTPV